MHFSSICLLFSITYRVTSSCGSSLEEEEREEDSSIGPLSSHFENWLNRNGYAKYDFPRQDDYGKNGRFGGKIDGNQKIHRTPVIFFHGNSDAALTTSPPFGNGFTEHVKYYMEMGYKLSELYATSWQDNDPRKAALRSHDCETISRLRAFMEAVLAYTKAPKVSIVSHSMGVTLARKVIKGGRIEEVSGKTCEIGGSLADRVEVLVGLSGGNQGLCNCHRLSDDPEYPTCNSKNGFWAGDRCGENTDCRKYPYEMDCTKRVYSLFLQELNDGQPEGDHVFSVWSKADELIKSGCWTWGQPTCLIPGSHGQMVYQGLSHLETRDLTPVDVYYMLTEKKIPIRNRKEL